MKYLGLSLTCCFLQEAISIKYLRPEGFLRRIENGGGDAVNDLLASRFGATTCKQICDWLSSAAGYFDASLPTTSPVYYAKCYDAVSQTPLNGRRLAFVSQLGTPEIDPSLPQTGNFCMRIKFI